MQPRRSVSATRARWMSEVRSARRAGSAPAPAAAISGVVPLRLGAAEEASTAPFAEDLPLLCAGGGGLDLGLGLFRSISRRYKTTSGLFAAAACNIILSPCCTEKN